MGKYRKKPVEIEAFQWLGRSSEVGAPEWFRSALKHVGTPGSVWIDGDSAQIFTLEGMMAARRDDWIIRGVEGEIYPCKPDIFEATYDEVDE
ncbi:putative phage protein [Nitrobacter winogradskyi Nb-255]|uniref:Putative phage protein n=1 Tax=Nitrobacter winogradskyi (strain ATCC 25391 / DSM 10237 / CIP 104748 / NCIMB 11846 / Nb-255) TaxID=323098 RepID=Q3SSC4_NITWN|nr:hypothetical protein [Nitrobacter winogradskyi]ABA04817.1 putative phage protein [Nitrobacter winogradskyi Nb-255]